MFEDEQFSKLLLGPIIIDTVNLEEKHGRVTPKDQQAATDLLSYLSKSVDVNVFPFKFLSFFSLADDN